jgi:hypothetical protein
MVSLTLVCRWDSSTGDAQLFVASEVGPAVDGRLIWYDPLVWSCCVLLCPVVFRHGLTFHGLGAT